MLIFLKIIFKAHLGSNNKHQMGFVDDSRRLNVSLTRARCGMIIFGHGETLRGAELWRKLFEHYNGLGCFMKARNLDRLFDPNMPRAVDIVCSMQNLTIDPKQSSTESNNDDTSQIAIQGGPRYLDPPASEVFRSKTTLGSR